MKQLGLLLSILFALLASTFGQPKSASAQEVETPANPVNSIAFSQDGKTFASAHVDGITRIWDASSGAIRHELTGHKMSVADVAYSPDGKLVASLSWDHSFEGAIRELKFGTHQIRIWDTQTGKIHRTIPLVVHEKRALQNRRNKGGLALEFLPNNTNLVTTGHAQGLTWLDDVCLWNLSGERLKVLSPPLPPGARLSHEGGAVAFAVSPEGRFVATAGTYFPTNPRGLSFKDRLAGRGFGLSTTIRLWNRKDGKVEKEENVEIRSKHFNIYDGTSWPIKPQSAIPLFSSNGKELFVVLHCGEVGVLEIPSLKETRRIKISKEPQLKMAITTALLPKDRVLVAHDTSLFVVNPANSQVNEIQLQRMTSPITALAVSPASEPPKVAIGCLDGTLGIWDLETRKRIVEAAK